MFSSSLEMTYFASLIYTFFYYVYYTHISKIMGFDLALIPISIVKYYFFLGIH